MTNGTMAGVLMNGMMTGVLLGWHGGAEQTYDTSASSFSNGVSDVSATSSAKRFEWVKMNLDTGAAVNTFPLNFGPEGAGDARFYRTPSGEWIPDGAAWQFQGYDENGLLRFTSHETFSRHFHPCAHITLWLKVSHYVSA